MVPGEVDDMPAGGDRRLQPPQRVVSQRCDERAVQVVSLDLAPVGVECACPADPTAHGRGDHARCVAHEAGDHAGRVLHAAHVTIEVVFPIGHAAAGCRLSDQAAAPVVVEAGRRPGRVDRSHEQAAFVILVVTDRDRSPGVGRVDRPAGTVEPVLDGTTAAVGSAQQPTRRAEPHPRRAAVRFDHGDHSPAAIDLGVPCRRLAVERDDLERGDPAGRVVCPVRDGSIRGDRTRRSPECVERAGVTTPDGVDDFRHPSFEVVGAPGGGAARCDHRCQPPDLVELLAIDGTVGGGDRHHVAERVVLEVDRGAGCVDHRVDRSVNPESSRPTRPGVGATTHPPRRRVAVGVGAVGVVDRRQTYRRVVAENLVDAVHVDQPLQQPGRAELERDAAPAGVGDRRQLAVVVPHVARDDAVGVGDRGRLPPRVQCCRGAPSVGVDHHGRDDVVVVVLQAGSVAGSIDRAERTMPVVVLPRLAQLVGVDSPHQVARVCVELVLPHGAGARHHSNRPVVLVVRDPHRRAVGVDDGRQIAAAVMHHRLANPTLVGDHRRSRDLVPVLGATAERRGLGHHPPVAVVLVHELRHAVGIVSAEHQSAVVRVVEPPRCRIDTCQGVVRTVRILDRTTVVGHHGGDPLFAPLDRDLPTRT